MHARARARWGACRRDQEAMQEAQRHRDRLEIDRRGAPGQMMMILTLMPVMIEKLVHVFVKRGGNEPGTIVLKQIVRVEVCTSTS